MSPTAGGMTTRFPEISLHPLRPPQPQSLPEPSPREVSAEDELIVVPLFVCLEQFAHSLMRVRFRLTCWVQSLATVYHEADVH